MKRNKCFLCRSAWSHYQNCVHNMINCRVVKKNFFKSNKCYKLYSVLLWMIYKKKSPFFLKIILLFCSLKAEPNLNLATSDTSTLSTHSSANIFNTNTQWSITFLLNRKKNVRLSCGSYYYKDDSSNSQCFPEDIPYDKT